MVESTEVVSLGNFFKVLSQFIQLPVLLPVKMGLHEGSNLIHRTNAQNKFQKKYVLNADDEKEKKKYKWI